jgi:hypothetical protein
MAIERVWNLQAERARTDKGLFMYLAWHNTHTPLECPVEWEYPSYPPYNNSNGARMTCVSEPPARLCICWATRVHIVRTRDEKVRWWWVMWGLLLLLLVGGGGWWWWRVLHRGVVAVSHACRGAFIRYPSRRRGRANNPCTVLTPKVAVLTTVLALTLTFEPWIFPNKR